MRLPVLEENYVTVIAVIYKYDNEYSVAPSDNIIDKPITVLELIDYINTYGVVIDDGNIELSPKITKIFNTNDNLYIIRSISIFTDKDYTHFVVSDTADNAIKKLRTCFGGRIISCGQVVSLDVVDWKENKYEITCVRGKLCNL